MKKSLLKYLSLGLIGSMHMDLNMHRDLKNAGLINKQKEDFTLPLRVFDKQEFRERNLIKKGCKVFKHKYTGDKVVALNKKNALRKLNLPKYLTNQIEVCQTV